MNRRTDVSEATRAAIVVKYLEGYSVRYLSAWSGLSYGAVHGVLVKAKVKMRKPGGRRKV